MCGIVAAFNKNAEVNEEVLLQFEDQSSRGTNGFGSIFINEDGTFSIQRATGQVKAIIDVKLKPTNSLIFHHRQPSSSKNKISQTHPIKISTGSLKHDYYIVHNGIIRNDKERKKIHNDEHGYAYSTEAEETGWYDKKEIMYNDSETLGYDLARFIEGQDNKVMSIGSAAFIITQVDKKTQKITKIFYGRNSGCPLKLAKTRDYLMLSSEGKGEMVKEDMLYSFKLDDFKIDKKKMPFQTWETTTTVSKKDDKKDTKVTGFGYNDDDDDDMPASGSTRKYWNGYDGYRSYDGMNRVDYEYPGAYDDEWMEWEDEKEFDSHFDDIDAELEAVKESIKSAKTGEELYLVDTEGIIRAIAVSLSKAIEHARSARIKGYLDSDAEATAIEKQFSDDVKGETIEAEVVELPQKLSSK